SSSLMGAPAEIVGVVGDVKEDALNTPAPPYVYTCVQAGWWPDPEYVVATQGDPRPILAAVREVVRRLAPQRAIFGVSTVAEHLDRTLDQPRINAGLLGVFALSALVSAALGLYGLVMLMVAARSTEIGVRIALGALPGRLLRKWSAKRCGLRLSRSPPAPGWLCSRCARTATFCTRWRRQIC